MNTKKSTRNRKANVPVIDTLVATLASAGAKKHQGPSKAQGLTVPQLVNVLHKKTGRPAESLTFTVRAQLSRLPNERKGVKIVKVRDGQNMRYFANIKKAA